MTRTVNVLVLTDMFAGGGGGAERHLEQVLRGLPAGEFRLQCIEFTDLPNLPCLDIPGVTLERWPLGPLLSLDGWRTYRRLSALIRDQGTTVILSYFEKSDFLAAALRMGNPGLRLVSSRRDTGFRNSIWVKWLYRRLNRAFAAFIAPSVAVHAYLASEGVPEHRITIVRNGVAPALLVTQQGRERVRSEFAVPATEFLVACIANLNPVKDHRFLLQGFANLLRQRPDCRLALLGTGPLEQALRAQSRDLGIADAVNFIGWTRQTSQWLQAADAFTLTSRTEGLSNALLEAQAQGLPAVVTAVGGNPEIVLDGRTGFLVPSGDAVAWCEAMRKLVDSPMLRAEMGAQARSRVTEAFGLPAMIVAYRTLLLGR